MLGKCEQTQCLVLSTEHYGLRQHETSSAISGGRGNLAFLPLPIDLDASSRPTRSANLPGDARRPAAAAQSPAGDRGGRARGRASGATAGPAGKGVAAVRRSLRGPAEGGAESDVRPGPADLGPAGRHRRGHPRPPGGDRLRRDGLGQIDPVAQDLPGDGPRRRRPDRPYPAATHRRAERGCADRRGNRLAPGPRRGLQGPLLRSHRAAKLRQAHDRRHPAGRDAERSVFRPVRYDHSRRGPRTLAERRFPHRLPEAAAAQAARSAADHHLGHDRRGPLCRAFRHLGRPGPGGRGLGADLSGRCLVAADGAGRGRQRARSARRRVGGGRGGGPHRSRRHADLHAHGTRYPRDGQDAPQPAVAGRRHGPGDGDPAALRAAFDPGAAARLPPGAQAARGHRHQRGRVVAHRAADPLRDRPGHGADQPLFAALEDPAAADRGRVAGLGRPAQGALRTRGAGHLPAAFRAKRISWAAIASPCRRSSGRTWPR